MDGQEGPQRGHKHLRWTDLEFIQDLSLHCITPSEASEVPILWRHSITYELDFRTFWEAEEQAILLRADLDGLLVCVFDDRLQKFVPSDTQDFACFDANSGHSAAQVEILAENKQLSRGLCFDPQQQQPMK